MNTITLNVESRYDIPDALRELANLIEGSVGEISHGMLGASGDTFEIDYDGDEEIIEDEEDFD